MPRPCTFSLIGWNFGYSSSEWWRGYEIYKLKRRRWNLQRPCSMFFYSNFFGCKTSPTVSKNQITVDSIYFIVTPDKRILRLASTGQCHFYLSCILFLQFSLTSRDGYQHWFVDTTLSFFLHDHDYIDVAAWLLSAHILHVRFDPWQFSHLFSGSEAAPQKFYAAMAHCILGILLKANTLPAIIVHQSHSHT